MKRNKLLITLCTLFYSTQGITDTCKFAMPWDASLSKFSLTYFAVPMMPYNPDPLEMMMVPPEIYCPTPIGIPYPCSTMGLWEPDRILESHSQPFQVNSVCLKLPLKSALLTTNKSEEYGSNSQQEIQVDYPLMSQMSMFKGAGCSTSETKSFGVKDFSEFSITKQVDVLAHLMAPWGLIMAIYPLQPISDVVQSVWTKVVRFSNSLLFASCEGPIFPASVHSTHQNGNIISHENENNHCKQLETQAYDFEKFQSTGIIATCYNHPNPIRMKGSDEFQPQGPITARGIRSGADGLKLDMPPIINFPSGEGTASFVWSGRQCCID